MHVCNVRVHIGFRPHAYIVHTPKASVRVHIGSRPHACIGLRPHAYMAQQHAHIPHPEPLVLSKAVKQ